MERPGLPDRGVLRVPLGSNRRHSGSDRGRSSAGVTDCGDGVRAARSVGAATRVTSPELASVTEMDTFAEEAPCSSSERSFLSASATLSSSTMVGPL